MDREELRRKFEKNPKEFYLRCLFDNLVFGNLSGTELIKVIDKICELSGCYEQCYDRDHKSSDK